MVAKDGDEARLRPNRGHLYIGPVITHDPLDFFETLGKKPVEFSWKDRSVARNDEFALNTSQYYDPRLSGRGRTF